MWQFLKELVRAPSGPRTLMILDEEGVAAPRHYHVNTRALVWGCAACVAGAFLLAVALLAFTPARGVLPGATTEQMRRTASVNAAQLSALRDSFRIQQQYVAQMQRLVTGQIDSTAASPQREASRQARGFGGSMSRPASEPSGNDWMVHEQPTFLIGSIPADEKAPVRTTAAASGSSSSLTSLQLPVRPPVEGFATRGFDANQGHFAVDIAVEEGTMVHSIGDGYVVMSDWTHEGGYTIAIQHADGFMSVYKHNLRLLKHIGDRVREREPVAISGNTGEITSGPHLHFELWRNGLAQDPQFYFLGW